MKKSELKQLIKEEIRKVISEKQTTNEILGFSEREKEVKRMKEDFNKAREEIKNFNPLTLFYELGDHGIKASRIIDEKPDIFKEAEKYLIRIYKRDFPALYKIQMNPKDYYYQTNLQPKGVTLVKTERRGRELYGITLSLQGIAPGIGNYRPMDKKAFEDAQLYRIDDAERILMRKKGGRFLDRT
jgi:hypothetical protein